MKRLTYVLIQGYEFLVSTTSAPVLGDAARPAGPPSAPGGPDNPNPRRRPERRGVVGALRQPGG